ncbi:hypothetical protein LWI29_003985 [Acer saccharum]|uniref:RNase H type-1 domain-containing protein n=1 Tax=Acer saccharum TaxID=4024 RepID=A0AA39SSQ7_ACESA|nr:hypothetical protein LWI29_003985 [Acer saccharum]
MRKAHAPDSISDLLLNVADRCSVLKPPKVVRTGIGVWNPPPFGALFFNVDGSARGNPGNAGIGGVLCDHSGKVLGSFSRNIGIVDAITAELSAIHQACVLCANSLGLIGKRITILSDSKVAVLWVNSASFGSLKFVNLIYDIRSLLSLLDGTEIIFNPRNSNSLVDSLAKKGSNEDGDLLLWEVA